MHPLVTVCYKQVSSELKAGEEFGKPLLGKQGPN